MSREFEWITSENKGILGSLDENGVVTFYINAGKGSSVRGTEFFNRMMDEFGDDVRVVHGVWRKNFLTGEESTNVDKVNELTASGTPIGEAIRFAWTATRAAKLGFTRIRLLGEPVGSPGAYSSIDVWIEKG